jgi:hypothetical protein
MVYFCAKTISPLTQGCCSTAYDDPKLSAEQIRNEHWQDVRSFRLAQTQKNPRADFTCQEGEVRAVFGNVPTAIDGGRAIGEDR